MAERVPVSRRRRYIWFFPLLLLASLADCDRPPLFAPTGSTIILVAERPVIVLGEETLVTATVIEPANTPVQDGTSVTFSTNLGSLDPQEATTQDGHVSVRLIAGDVVGVASVTAFSGNTISTPITIAIGASAP